MSGQHYCLRWNNYQTNMTSVFHQLLKTEAFVDVTLSCNDNTLKAHKVVLSACSSYFQKLLMQNPCTHPTIILPVDVAFSDLRVIIDFVYRGEIDVDQAQLQSLLKTADQLKIKGLCEVSDPREIEEPDLPYRPLQVFEPAKSLNLENVLQPTVTYKTPSEITVNQVPRIKQSNSPVFLQEGFIPVKQLPIESDSKRPKRKPSPTINQAATQFPAVSTGGALNNNGITGRSSPPRKRPRAAVKDRGVQSDSGDNMMNLQQGAGTMPLHHDAVEQAGLRHHEPQVWRWVNNNGERVPECITVATSTAEDEKNVPMVILERPITNMPMIVHNLQTSTGHPLSPHHLIDSSNSNPSCHSSGEQTPPEVEIPPEAQPPAPSATLVENLDLTEQVEHAGEPGSENSEVVKVKFETLRSVDQSGDTVDMDSHMSDRNQEESDQSMQTMMITPELLGLLPSSSGNSGRLFFNGCEDGFGIEADVGDGEGKGGKAWTQEDMDMALDALRNHNMSLTKASATYGIPSTTLWQRAHRLGIDTPKKEGSTKNWTEDNLNSALEALRTGTISANKASKAFGIPSSTLYKIARREGIRLAAPFNAAPTAWTQEDLERALESIRSGQASVQRASTEFGIPTGTLYGRCKREGIELSRSNPTPWSEDAMGEALEAVRVGQMSINQAAIHYNLPYSSLYGRFKRGKFDADDTNPGNGDLTQSGLMLAGYGDGYPVTHQGYQQHQGS